MNDTKSKMDGPRAAALVELLVCPIHRTKLTQKSDGLICVDGCKFPVIAGVPVLLPRDVAHTHSGIAADSFTLAEEVASGRHPVSESSSSGEIDDVMQRLVAATNSVLYLSLIGRLTDYPIPILPMAPARRGDLLLDIGCGWGRWCIAAARAGFRPVGIAPSLESVLAARRLAQYFGIAADFVVGDSRYLPFAPDSFDAAYSYSVLQHFADDDVRATLRCLAAVMKPGGTTKLHLLNRYGLRSLQVQWARGWREAQGFETRYWSPRQLRQEIAATLGPTHIEIDGFFVQGRYEDRHLFRPHHRAIVELCHFLTLSATWLPFLKLFADNLFFVSQIKAAASTTG